MKTQQSGTNEIEKQQDDYLSQFQIKTRLDKVFKRKTKTVVRVEHGKRIEVQFAIDQYETSSESDQNDDHKTS